MQNLSSVLCSSDKIGVEKSSLEAAPKLMITLLKWFRNFENSVKKNYKQVKLPISKIMIVERYYGLKGATNFSQNSISGHYTTSIKFKKSC